MNIEVLSRVENPAVEKPVEVKVTATIILVGNGLIIPPLTIVEALALMD